MTRGNILHWGKIELILEMHVEINNDMHRVTVSPVVLKYPFKPQTPSVKTDLTV